jgi:Domain of unknown function (DUF3817)
MELLTDPRLLRKVSYAHSLVYLVLLWAAFVDRHDGVVAVCGWAHGLLWIGMSLLCIEAVRRRRIPLWLGVMVAVIGGIGPFAGSIGFAVEQRRSQARREQGDPAMLG